MTGYSYNIYGGGNSTNTYGGNSTSDSSTTGCYCSSTNTTSIITGYWSPIYYQEYQFPPETEEQQRIRLEQQGKYELEQEKIRKEQEVAKQKADELLKSHIGVDAFGKLHEIGHIELDSQKYEGRKYRIPNYARNLIEVIENDKVIDRLCVHPTERYQDGDEILARLTLLQYAEEYLLKVANHNPIRV